MKIGVDLGTSYSLVATLTPAGHPVLIPDFSDRDEIQTPSVVHLGSSGTFVGSLVETLLEQQPELKAIRYFKRSLGTDLPLHFDEQGAAWHPEAVAALVLKKLRFDAESYSGSTVDGAVITIPAHFNDLQRKAVLSAAMLADVPVLGLIEEPVAAALHYGVVHDGADRVRLVYDLGGGTFDVSILSMDSKGVYVLGKGGLTDLGGKEFDERVAAMIVGQFERALGGPPPLGARSLLDLRRIAEEMKIELCSTDAPRVGRAVVLGENAVEVSIERREFESAVGDLIDRTVSTCLSCLSHSGLQARDVQEVLLVGGGSMVPSVRRRLEQVFSGPGQEIRHHEPSRAVALGAALRAAQLGDETRPQNLPPELRGVSGHTVAVRTVDPLSGRPSFDPVIRRGAPLPARSSRVYFATRPDQTRVVIELAQYADVPDDYVSLGCLLVEPLPAPAQNYPIEVVVENQDDGTIAVSATGPRGEAAVERTLVRAALDGASHMSTQRSLVRSTLVNHL